MSNNTSHDLEISEQAFLHRTQHCQIEIKIIPSYHCNINCKYCYNNGIDNGFYNENLPLIKNQLDRIFQQTHNNVSVIVEIIGGEPLSPKIFPVTCEIIHNLRQQNANIKIVVQTGTSDIEKIYQIIPLVDGLSYSIDISSSPKVKNAQNLLKICHECQEHSVLTQIQTILDISDNPKTIIEFIKTCESSGAGWIGLEYPQYQRYSQNLMDHQISVYLELIEALKGITQITIGGAIIESTLDYIHGNSYSSSCMCGEKSITIQPDGSISPSLHFFINKKNTIPEFLNLKKIRSSALRDGICGECDYWGVCHGGCMAHAEFLTGSSMNRDEEYCYILSNVIKTL